MGGNHYEPIGARHIGGIWNLKGGMGPLYRGHRTHMNLHVMARWTPTTVHPVGCRAAMKIQRRSEARSRIHPRSRGYPRRPTRIHPRSRVDSRGGAKNAFGFLGASTVSWMRFCGRPSAHILQFSRRPRSLTTVIFRWFSYFSWFRPALNLQKQ